MRLIHISSIEDTQIAEYTHLTELQLRNRLEPEHGVFIAESPKVITRALNSGVEVKSFLVEEPWLSGMSDTFAFVDAHWGY
jgi:hypothetical protein